MKKKHLAELIENLESRIRFMEARVTKLEMEAFRVNPITPSVPASHVNSDDKARCHFCGLSGMSAYVCTRVNCPTKTTTTCSVPSVPDTSNHALDDIG